MNNMNISQETLKSYILADRLTLLNRISNDCQSVNAKDAFAFLKNFEKHAQEKYMSIEMPQIADKKRKKKVVRFRKTSPYLAFCGSFRESKRGSDGKIEGKIPDITREAGAKWKSMTEKEKKPWISKAEEITKKSKAAWDLKMQEKEVKPSAESIRLMKKVELTKLINKDDIVIPSRVNLKDMKELIVSYYYPVEPPVPSEEDILKMKKKDLLVLIEKCGITVKKDNKSMQKALVEHYRNDSS